MTRNSPRGSLCNSLGRSFGFVELGKDAPALFVECAAGGGDADAPRGAVKQARAEALLELEHMFAGRGARQAERVRGAR